MNQPKSSLAADSDPGAQPVSTESARPCLACGYNLQGLGEEPRCPECGLLNIPEGYRRQVWELVDSGTWFFSSFFGFFRKRPPGWWWSLDRSGDVKRALKRSILYIALMLVIVWAGSIGASMVQVEAHQEINMKSWPGPDNRRFPHDIPRPQVEHVLIQGERWIEGIRGGALEQEPINRVEVLPAGNAPILTNYRRSRLTSPRGFESDAIIFSIFVLSLWLVPASCGIWSQIRKGLPSFARPRRSIIAASLYEAHRLIYLGIVACVGLSLDAFLRYYFPTASFDWDILHTVLLSLGVFAALGWVGPLRSDYTRQLIRSRWHAARIILVYVPLLLWFLALAIVLAIFDLL